MILERKVPELRVGNAAALIDIDRRKPRSVQNRSAIAVERRVGRGERADGVGDVVDGGVRVGAADLVANGLRGDVEVGVGDVLIAGERKALERVGRADRGLRRGSIGEADARLEAHVVGWPQGLGIAAGSGEAERGGGREAVEVAGDAWTNIGLVVELLHARRLQLIAQAGVDGEVRQYLPVVLEVAGIVAPAVVAGDLDRRIGEAGDRSQDEGGERRSSGRAVVGLPGGEGVPAAGGAAEIVLVGLQPANLASELEQVVSMCPGHIVTGDEVLVDLDRRVREAHLHGVGDAVGVQIAEAGEAIAE